MTVKSSTTTVAAGYTTTLRNNMRNAYQGHLSSYFGSTLNQVPDIVNVLVAQAYYESRLNTNALGPTIPASSSLYKDYLNSPIIVNFLKTANPTQVANVQIGLQALGLGQSMGLNSVRGASAKTGKCLIESARPDLSGQLCINPGDDLVATFLGDANLSRACLAQLVILEAKYKQCIPNSSGGYSVKGDPYNRIFPSQIAAAVGAYLGLGGSDQNGVNASAYAAAIVGGSTYAIANGVSLQVAQRNVQLASAAGPSTNGSGQARVIPAGC